MKRSDSRRPLSGSSLSLDLPSRLALVVSAAGEHRVSLVPNGPFFACHALRPRQTPRCLTFDGTSDFGFRRQNILPACI